MDIAQLGFAADTSDLVDAKKRLEDIEPAAKKAEVATERFQRQIAASDKMLVPFGSKLKGLTGTVKEFSIGFLGAFGGIGAFFGGQKIVSVLSDFEYQMSAVAAVSGATGETLERLRDTAKELGATTEFSASQAAGGLKLLVQAGYDADDAMATLPAILNLATTEAMDLGVATEYVNSIMAGFGLSVQDAGRVTDVLVYASNAASTGVAELGEGMKYVGPISKALGISIEDTAAAMGLLSDAGLKGSMAGTSLRASLAALASPTKMASKELARLGVSVDEVNPKTNSIVDIVDRLADANLDASSAFKIFGREAAPAFLALIANRDKLKQLTDEMGNVQGEAQRIADYMRDNFKGSLQGLGSVLEGLIIALGEAGLTTVLRFAVDNLTAFVSGVITVIGAVSSWVSASVPLNNILSLVAENSNLIVAAVGGVAAAYMASYIPAIVAATAAQVSWIASMYIMNGGLAGMAAAAISAAAGFITLRGAIAATGFGAIVIAVGLVIAKVLDLADEVGGLGAAFRVLGDTAGLVWQFIKDSSQSIPPVLAAVWAKIRQEFYIFVADLSYKWADFLTFIKAGLEMIGAAETAAKLANGPILEATKAGSDAIVAADEAGKEVSQSLGKAADTVVNAYENMRLGFEQSKTDAKLAALGLDDLTASIFDVGGTSETVADTLGDDDGLGGGLDDLGDSAGGAAGKTEELKTALQLLTEEFQKLSEPFDQASNAFDALEKAKENGIIGNDAYVASLQRIQDAFLATGGTAEQWAKIIGKNTESVGKQLDDVAKGSVEDLSKSFVDLMVDGSANFGQLAKNIIKQLLNIAIQAMIVKPLLSWMGFSQGGTFGGGDKLTGALQGAGVGAVQPFAHGGTFTNSVVNAPTPFKFAQGGGFSLGVMGEAGPEAVMPLTRGPDGSLGVQMYNSQGRSSRAPESTEPARVELTVIGEEGPMFRPTIKAVARDESVEVVTQYSTEMNAQLPDRVEQILADPRLKGA